MEERDKLEKELVDTDLDLDIIELIEETEDDRDGIGIVSLRENDGFILESLLCFFLSFCGWMGEREMETYGVSSRGGGVSFVDDIGGGMLDPFETATETMNCREF